MSWITFTSPRGITLDLDDRIHYTVLTNSGGFLMPNYSFSMQSLTQNLSRYQQFRAKNRVVEISLHIEGKTAEEFSQAMATLIEALDPLEGDGILTVTRDDGEQRQLTCRYTGGAEGQYETGSYGITWMDLILNMQAIDPYWYGVDPIEAEYAAVDVETQAFFPDVGGTFFPLNLEASNVIGLNVVTNPGQKESWPIWGIFGPGSGLELKNLTTGKRISLDYEIGDGHVVTIDTRPGKKTVLLDDGTNLFGNLSIDSALFSFIQGSNEIQISLVNASMGVSKIVLSFFPVYLSE